MSRTLSTIQESNKKVSKCDTIFFPIVKVGEVNVCGEWGKDVIFTQQDKVKWISDVGLILEEEI